MSEQVHYTRMLQRQSLVSVAIWIIPSFISIILLLTIINEWLLFDKVEPVSFEPEERLYQSNHQLTDFNLKGKDETGGLYELLAEHATQWATDTNSFEFGAFALSVPLDENTNIHYSSSYGSYFRNSEILKMGSPVDLKLNNRQSFSANDISASLRELTIEAKGNVIIDYAPLEARSAHMTIDIKNRTVKLGGRVHIHVRPWSRLK